MDTEKPSVHAADTEKKRIRKIINAEISKKMAAMRAELLSDVTALVQDIYNQQRQELMNECDKKMRLYAVQSSNILKTDIEKKINKTHERNLQQITVIANDKRDRDLVIKQEVAIARDQIINEISTKIVPKINDAVQWINYNLQDGNEIVDHYRRAVETQSRASDDIKLLTTGNDKRVISPYVYTLFADNEE